MSGQDISLGRNWPCINVSDSGCQLQRVQLMSLTLFSVSLLCSQGTLKAHLLLSGMKGLRGVGTLKKYSHHSVHCLCLQAPGSDRNLMVPGGRTRATRSWRDSQTQVGKSGLGTCLAGAWKVLNSQPRCLELLAFSVLGLLPGSLEEFTLSAVLVTPVAVRFQEGPWQREQPGSSIIP